MSDKQTCNNRIKNFLIVILVAVVLLSIPVSSKSAMAQDGNWTMPIVISTSPDSPTQVFAWFPDLAVDMFGFPHVVWCKTVPLETGGLQEQVNYVRWNGKGWSEPNDIVPPSADIVRNAIALDQRGNAHLLFGGSVYNLLALYYQNAPLNEAWSATAWSAPHRINQGISYMGDIAVDSHQVLHVVYDDTMQYTGNDEPTRADIFYRRSTNGGRTWSSPINLYPTSPTGSSRPSLEIDSNDIIHVTWDEGWDRLSGEGGPAYSYYTTSSDGGKTWFPPVMTSYPDSTVAQLTVGSNGQDGVMLVWRSASRNELFYQWSTDGGHSWQAPSVIPRVFSRPWTNPFDMYDMATDSSGNIHLVIVGRESQEQAAPLGVYHLVWDGIKWSLPYRIFLVRNLYPEYPKIVVHAGNQLHAAWFTREGSIWDQTANREVWYANAQSNTPHQAVTPMPTFTAVSPTATPSPTPMATIYPTLEPDGTGLPDGLYTESDDVLRLAIALLPVALMVLVVVGIKMGWFSKLR